MNKHFGLRIKELREEAGESKAALSRAVKTSKVTVGEWENEGIGTLSSENLLALAEHFNVSPFYILRGVGTKTLSPKASPDADLLLTILKGVELGMADEGLSFQTDEKIEIISSLYDYFRSSKKRPRDDSQIIDLMKFRLASD